MTRGPGPRVVTIDQDGTPVPYDVRFWNGRAVVPERVKTWKRAVSIAARLAMLNESPIQGPVSVTYTFRLKRPKKPRASWPIVRPDLLSLVRPTEDALTGIIWRDDSQVVNSFGLKRYVLIGEVPGIHILVREVAS